MEEEDSLTTLSRPERPLLPGRSQRRRRVSSLARGRAGVDTHVLGIGSEESSAFSSSHGSSVRAAPLADGPSNILMDSSINRKIENCENGASGNPRVQVKNLVAETQQHWGPSKIYPPLVPPPNLSDNSTGGLDESTFGIPGHAPSSQVGMFSKKRTRSRSKTLRRTPDDFKIRRMKKQQKTRETIMRGVNDTYDSVDAMDDRDESGDSSSSPSCAGSLPSVDSPNEWASSQSMSDDDNVNSSNSDSGTTPICSSSNSNSDSDGGSATSHPPPLPSANFTYQQTNVFSVLGGDNTTVLLSFLTPWEQYYYLSAPLNRLYRNTVTLDDDLWRRSCQFTPFKLGTNEPAKSLVYNSYTVSFGPYRQMFQNFLKCFFYLETKTAAHVIQENDKVNRNFQTANERFCLPAFVTYGNPRTTSSAAAAVTTAPAKNVQSVVHSIKSTLSLPAVPTVASPGSSVTRNLYGLLPRKLMSKTPKHAARLEMINQNFDGLPFTSTIYTIANWMMFYDNVEGIISACLSTLSSLLNEESQRDNAQRIGLTDIVLRAMCCFKESVEIHENAAKAMVTLARPIGGREGAVYELFMSHGSELYNVKSKPGRFGIAVILDSMERFVDCWRVQSMSCWSLINISLIPAQKRILIKLGGIEKILNALRRHPYNEEVVFRALFSLVNLVSPQSRTQLITPEENAMITSMIGPSLSQKDEMTIIHDNLDEIISLTTQGLSRFKHCADIVERGHQVFFNLSLSPSTHEAIIFHGGGQCINLFGVTKNLYEKEPNIIDNVRGTIRRLGQTLDNSSLLKGQFEKMMTEFNRRQVQDYPVQD